MMGLTNRDLDAYLSGKLRNTVIIPAQSYDTLFGWDGRPVNQDLIDAINMLRPVACCVNTDPSGKPGAHWVSIIVYPREKQVFYYDSLLPGRVYSIPHNLQMFLSKCRHSGWAVYENPKADQHKTIALTDGNGRKHRIVDDMCGAYAAQMIVLVDGKKDHPLAFADAHNRLDDAEYIRDVFTRMR